MPPVYYSKQMFTLAIYKKYCRLKTKNKRKNYRKKQSKISDKDTQIEKRIILNSWFKKEVIIDQSLKKHDLTLATLKVDHLKICFVFGIYSKDSKI